MAPTPPSSTGFSGPPLPTNKPISIKSGSSYVRTDTTPGAATVGSGSGTSLPEQYVAYTPSNLASTAPVQPGDTAILRSRLTGQFCKLATLPSGKQGMVCDQATAATATVFKYTGSGLEYNNQPLVATGAGQPLVLAGSGNPPASGDSSLAFSSASEPVLHS
jgi:hypothetical protein